MSQSFRLKDGGRIDRTKPLSFSFDGRQLTGYHGDTLASALLANGVHLVGRSFKYHRPRGILSAGSEEPNALITVSRDAARMTPNLRATQIELYAGLQAESQNRWPSLSFDVGAVNDLLAPTLAAGFYYKTFMWPKNFWHKLYEPVIRAAAGLGRAPTLPDPDRYAQLFAFCDVLVVGAGPAGLAAARAAAASGASVILCDEQNEFGGSLLSYPDAIIEGQPAARWIVSVLTELAGNERVTLLPRTTAFGYGPHSMIGLDERVTEHQATPDPLLPRQRLWQVRAKQVVLAAGALERPIIFPDNDRPGTMLAGAAQCYARRFAVKAGERAVLIAGHDGAYQTALDLQSAGVTITAIIDPRRDAGAPQIEAAKAAGLTILAYHSVSRTGGRLRVKSLDAVSLATATTQRIPCDLVLSSAGFTPTVHLFSQSRGKLTFDSGNRVFLPGLAGEPVRAAGACRGVSDLEGVVTDGGQAGETAAAASHGRSLAMKQRPISRDAGYLGELPKAGRPSGHPAFVDFQNDVASKDIALAVREGFRSIEHIKRYTTTGMATDQGKTSNMNALAIASGLLDKTIPEVGLTTFRQPYTPTSFGIFAGHARGELFDPVRRTPIHQWAVEQGAVFEDVSLWKRARFFPKAGEDMHKAVNRECLATRSGVGIFDASTLGKIEVVGRDAAEFMNRIYVNPWTKLEAGRCRYGVMLREDGMIMDDGVVGRLSEGRFHVTTTTGGAPRVLAMMEDYLQTEWPDLDVWLTSTTEQWAVIAVQGPKARELLAPLVEDIDLSAAAMPHMSVRTGRICGVETRLFRVSFSGELGFEVNVPSSHGRAVWEAICKAGEAYGITPYGTETMHVLRAEKGYIIVGQETDGTVTPDDAGLSWAVGKLKQDFVGKRSLARPALAAAGRKQLVGLLTQNPQTVLEEGAQIVAAGQAVGPALGHVTSSYYSAVLGHSIALALVADGRNRHGEQLSVPMPDGPLAVTVVGPVFLDPEGVRLDV
jgi:sarcosine oxidase subunit alpha